MEIPAAHTGQRRGGQQRRPSYRQDRERDEAEEEGHLVPTRLVRDGVTRGVLSSRGTDGAHLDAHSRLDLVTRRTERPGGTYRLVVFHSFALLQKDPTT